MRASSGGPCCHCGTIQTPCWRKGPPEKPTLCNACGSRYLVKGSLAGYFPGARRSAANPARSEHPVVISKGPRKATPPAIGAKRKSHDVESYEGQAQRLYDDYDLEHQLAFAAVFCRGRAYAATTASDSSDHAQQEDACFKGVNYLDASSDDPEPGLDLSPFHGLTTTTATGVSGPRPPMFHRRPRKQMRPVACSC